MGLNIGSVGAGLRLGAAVPAKVYSGSTQVWPPAAPTLSVGTPTTTGGTVTITNYDASLSYNVSSSHGSASRSGNTITVTGAPSGTAITVYATALAGFGASPQASIGFTTLVSAWTATINSGNYGFSHVASNGDVSVINYVGDCVKISSSKTVLTTAALRYNGNSINPVDIAWDSSGNAVLIGNAGSNDRLLMKLNSSFGVVWTRLITAGSFNLSGVSVDPSGNIAVSIGGPKLVIKFNSSGTVLWSRTWSHFSTGGYGVAAASDGAVWVPTSGDGSTSYLSRLDANGNVQACRQFYTYPNYYRVANYPRPGESGNVYTTSDVSQPGSGNGSAGLLKFNTSTSTSWVRYFRPASQATASARNNALYVDGSGNIVVTALSESSKRWSAVSANSSGGLVRAMRMYTNSTTTPNSSYRPYRGADASAWSAQRSSIGYIYYAGNSSTLQDTATTVQWLTDSLTWGGGTQYLTETDIPTNEFNFSDGSGLFSVSSVSGTTVAYSPTITFQDHS